LTPARTPPHFGMPERLWKISSNRGAQVDSGSLRGASNPGGDAVRQLARPQGCRRGVETDLPSRRAEAARIELEAFKASELGRKNPHTVAVFENAWERFTPFLAFPPMLRRVIYTTNSIESLNYQLRKIIKNRGHFPGSPAPAVYRTTPRDMRPAGAGSGRLALVMRQGVGRV
jgi:hypothetical protein